jgi:hypothetical protein
VIVIERDEWRRLAILRRTRRAPFNEINAYEQPEPFAWFKFEFVWSLEQLSERIVLKALSPWSGVHSRRIDVLKVLCKLSRVRSKRLPLESIAEVTASSSEEIDDFLDCCLPNDLIRCEATSFQSRKDALAYVRIDQNVASRRQMTMGITHDRDVFGRHRRIIWVLYGQKTSSDTLAARAPLPLQPSPYSRG